MKKGIVDRFEGEYVVIEIDENNFEDVPRKWVSPEVSPGDIVELREGIWRPNPSETKARREEIKKLEDELFYD